MAKLPSQKSAGGEPALTTTKKEEKTKKTRKPRKNERNN